ncbi:MAG: DUF1559 domain-containing protein [Armatimonadetes bacterium]|nr:DUF1559 domain-containing protein [Armatimonadota bacterium]
MLVVIAIIAILAAILFPVFARAREKARQASCTSNVKQGILAGLMYAQDYDERLPSQTLNPASTEGYPMWYDVIQPYIKNDQMRRCPSVSGSAMGYGWTVLIPRTGQPLGSIVKPAESIILADNNAVRGFLRGGIGSCGHGDCVNGQFLARHNDVGNCGFADGHVKALKYQAVYDVNTCPSYLMNLGNK